MSIQANQWLREMQLQYLSRADEKLAELSCALDFFVSTPDDDSQRRLRRLLHNLVGSGGSFGFPAISKAAKAMAEVLRRMRETNRSLDARTVKDLQAGLGRLRRAFEQAAVGAETEMRKMRMNTTECEPQEALPS